MISTIKEVFTFLVAASLQLSKIPDNFIVNNQKFEHKYIPIYINILSEKIESVYYLYRDGEFGLPYFGYDTLYKTYKNKYIRLRASYEKFEISYSENWNDMWNKKLDNNIKQKLLIKNNYEVDKNKLLF